MPLRVTLLMAVTTDPTDRASASPHSGGWSESFYLPAVAFQNQAFFQSWGTGRALLLAGECSVIGYRQQLVTIAKNRLLPGGSAAGSLNIPGAFGTDLNAPQDSLMINFGLAGQPQNVRHRLPGIPDSQVANGEYQPSATMKGNITKYISYVVATGYAGIVRDLTQPDARVRSLTGGVLTTLSPTGAAAGDWIRLRRVKDTLGDPVEGAYLVSTVVINADGTVSYTLFNGPGQTVSTPNGTARHDVLVSAAITSGVPNRLVIRKVGRPFVVYRGRRSKRRV